MYLSKERRIAVGFYETHNKKSNTTRSLNTVSITYHPTKKERNEWTTIN